MMVTNNYRAIAPQVNISAHAHMLNACAEIIAPRSHTPVKHESQPPRTCYPHTPISTFQSASREFVVNGSDGTCSPPAPFETTTNSSAKHASSPSRSPRLKLHLTPRRTYDTDRLTRQITPEDVTDNGAGRLSAGRGSILKLKLRGIQAALKGLSQSTNSASAYADSPLIRKRTSEVLLDDRSDTDSEIDIMPLAARLTRHTAKKQHAHIGAHRMKKVKLAAEDSDFEDEDTKFDTAEEEGLHASCDSKLILSSNLLKRSERILDPAISEHAKLIAAAPKAGAEYYDSDADELPGNVKETNKPHLFRNVKWGSLATDYSNPSDFTTEPEFTQFVPGRYERLPNGTASDQKRKLIVKLTDKQHRQRIFLNPPPRDWTSQEAITALNKRTVQQIRRNTAVRFRDVVEPYVRQERAWILAHLTEGKPVGGWKRFVDGFNGEFAGKVLDGVGGRRPERSHSSLTKEVERFGRAYRRGVVPRTVVQGKSVRKGRGRKGE